MHTLPPYADAILNLSDEELLALIPDIIAPPSVEVLIPNGNGTSFRHTIPVQPGDTRQDLANAIYFFCGELLEQQDQQDQPDEGDQVVIAD